MSFLHGPNRVMPSTLGGMRNTQREAGRQAEAETKGKRGVWDREAGTRQFQNEAATN